MENDFEKHWDGLIYGVGQQREDQEEDWNDLDEVVVGGEDQFVQVEEVDQRAEEGHEKDYIFDDGAIPEFGHWFLIEDYTFALGKSEGVGYIVWAL